MLDINKALPYVVGRTDEAKWQAVRFESLERAQAYLDTQTPKEMFYIEGPGVGESNSKSIGE